MSFARLEVLTGMRFVAAMAVVLFHFVHQAFPRGSFPERVLLAGFTSVNFFFVLSGFVLTEAYRDEPFTTSRARWSFYRNRFARIYPVYLVALAVGVVGALQGQLISEARFYSSFGLERLVAVALVFPLLWKNAVFIFDWALWSIMVEAVFYAMFPWLLRGLRALAPRMALIVAAMAFVATMALIDAYDVLDPDALGRAFRLGDEQTTWGHILKFWPIAHLHQFLVGMAAALALSDRGGSLSAGQRDLFVVTLAILATTLAYLGVRDFYLFLHSGVLAPIYAAIMVLAAREGAVGWLFGSRVAGFAGRASYALYALHVPVFFIVRHYVAGRLEAPAFVSLYLTVTLVAAAVVYVVVEEPARRRLRAPT